MFAESMERTRIYLQTEAAYNQSGYSQPVGEASFAGRGRLDVGSETGGNRR